MVHSPRIDRLFPSEIVLKSNFMIKLLIYYLTFSLPVRALLMQTTSVDIPFPYLNPSRIINMGMLVINFIFIIVFHNFLLSKKSFRHLSLVIIVLLFYCLIQPLFFFMFTGSIKEFSLYSKLAVWMTTIPLACIAFNDNRFVRKIKVSAGVTFFIILFSVILANIFQIGSTAYNLKLLHLGFFEESSLSMALTMLLPFFFLPSGKSGADKAITPISLLLIFILFIFIVLVMKRASIIAFILCYMICILLIGQHKRIVFSKLSASLLISLFTILIGSIVLLLAIRNPEFIGKRFKDVTKYEKTNDIRYLGAGRIRLAEQYLKIYMKRPLHQQVFGINIAGHIENKGGYLDTEFIVPHNDFIEFLIRNGAAGLIIYLYFLAIVFLLIWKSYKTADTAFCAQASIAMAGMFSIYIVFAFAGTVFRVFPMTCFAILLGATAGVNSSSGYSESASIV